MILIIMGVAGAGKTTIGKLLSEVIIWEFYDGNELHPKRNIEKMRKGIALNDKDRLPWLNSIRKLIEKKLHKKENLILECSALRQSYRDLLKQKDEDIRFIYLKGNYQLIEKRLAQRRHRYFNPALLKSQFDTLEEPQDAISIDAFKTPQMIVAMIRNNLGI